MDDIAYYRKRAIEEQIAASNATCTAARLRHEEMAAMYRFRVSQLSDILKECAALRLAGERLVA